MPKSFFYVFLDFLLLQFIFKYCINIELIIDRSLVKYVL